MQESSQQKFYQKAHRADRRARWLITSAGYGIVVAILLIMGFLIYQSLPLSFGASVDKLLGVSLNDAGRRVLLTGADPYMQSFYTVQEDGKVAVYHTRDGSELYTAQLPLSRGEKLLSAAKGSLTKSIFAVGTNAGRIITAEIKLKPVYDEAGTRTVQAGLEVVETWEETRQDSTPLHIERLSFRLNEDLARCYVWLDHQDQLKGRFFDAEYEEEYPIDFSGVTPRAETRPTAMAMSYDGETLMLAREDGSVLWFSLSDPEDVLLKDSWKASESLISAMEFLLGNQALIIGAIDGEVQEWMPVRTQGNHFAYQKIRRFKQHRYAVTQIYSSSRNRNFLTIDAKAGAQLNYSTTGQTQLTFQPADFPIEAAAITPKSNGLLFVDSQHEFSLFSLTNPHPETTLKSLFGKVWYEGYPGPELVWQSTGGSSEFEPKLSLIPLIFGTMKGTLFAMIFSVPIALLSAIYISQFAPKRLSRVVKPTVEIMAGIPSVVIGFLAGLYFAPLFEKTLMTILMSLILIPLTLLAGMLIWRMIPEERRVRLPMGGELALTLPLMLVALGLSFALGHPVERWLFDGNFQQWIYHHWGMTYESRNSLVVGFALGFAVIPIIFTVADDSLRNVPESLTSASLALGASRWQTVRRVVLPAASGGIFAATMLGLGRAVGETMIVLMATGNTPILDLSPFNGFRAMSACIAVEIPEAPVGGTLYRVLFLTALLLFVFTFVLNTLSALIGDKLRKKYARF